MKHDLILEAQQRRMDDKLRASIDALKGLQAIILILPGLSECQRCSQMAHITRKVPGEWRDLEVCTQCAIAAQRLGLTVVEI